MFDIMIVKGYVPLGGDKMKPTVIVIGKNERRALTLFEDYIEPVLNIVDKKKNEIETDNLIIRLKSIQNAIVELKGYSPKYVYLDDELTYEEYTFIYLLVNKDHTKIVVI
jgi:hypothetical protein